MISYSWLSWVESIGPDLLVSVRQRVQIYELLQTTFHCCLTNVTYRKSKTAISSFVARGSVAGNQRRHCRIKSDTLTI